MGNRVQIAVNGELHVPKTLGVVDAVLRETGGFSHGLHCLHREFARGGFAAEHDGG